MSVSRAPLVDAVAPGASTGATRDVLLVTGAALLTAVAAQLALPLPFSPVPVTGQTFAVLLAGAALGARRGAASQVAYLAAGAAGAPVFAGGAGTVATFAGPTAGYLLAFPLAAWIVGALAERGWDRRVPTTLAAMALGTAAIFAGGLAWLSLVLPPGQLLAAGLLPFLPGAAVKIAAAAGLLPACWRLVGRDDEPDGGGTGDGGRDAARTVAGHTVGGRDDQD